MLIPIELNELLPVVVRNTETVVNPYPDLNAGTLRFWVDTPSGSTLNMDAPIVSSGQHADGSYYSQIKDTGVGATAPYRRIAPANLFADGTNTQISGSTIAELRTAFQIQKLFERDSRGGTRYVEMLKAHFGVEAQDYRLQRPEFLGRLTSYIGTTQVPQTSSSDATSPQGNLAAYTHSWKPQTRLFEKSFVEHGVVIVIACARQVKSYQQGIEKFHFKRDRFDFYYPALAHISEQPVLNREIYITNPANIPAQGPSQNLEVFGYNEAWYDMRYKPNQISGNFTYASQNSLYPWHYGTFFDAQPVLSDSFIKDDSDINIDRTLAIPSSHNDQIIGDFAFFNKATRPLPVYSVPGLVDHF
jgi:hypothetical protein